MCFSFICNLILQPIQTLFQVLSQSSIWKLMPIYIGNCCTNDCTIVCRSKILNLCYEFLLRSIPFGVTPKNSVKKGNILFSFKFGWKILQNFRSFRPFPFDWISLNPALVPNKALQLVFSTCFSSIQALLLVAFLLLFRITCLSCIEIWAVFMVSAFFYIQMNWWVLFLV